MHRSNGWAIARQCFAGDSSRGPEEIDCRYFFAFPGSHHRGSDCLLLSSHSHFLFPVEMDTNDHRRHEVPGFGSRPRIGLANLGGAAGGMVFGFLTSRIGLKPLTIAILVLNAVAVVSFGQSPVVLSTLTMLAVGVGFFGNAAVSGLYSIVAYGFPTHVAPPARVLLLVWVAPGAALSPILQAISSTATFLLRRSPLSWPPVPCWQHSC